MRVLNSRGEESEHGGRVRIIVFSTSFKVFKVETAKESSNKQVNYSEVCTDQAATR